MDNSTQYEREHQSGPDGNGRNGHAPEVDDRILHFGGNPGRRNGERWHVRMPHEADAKRLYGRAAQPEPPAPEDLREVYADALTLIADYRPLRAAYLNHLIGRTMYAFRRYCAVKRENEANHQNANEEARNADEWLDNRVGQMRAERDEVENRWNEEIDERRDKLADANEKAAVAHTASGHPMPYRYRGQEDETGTSPGGSMAAQAAEAIGRAAPEVIGQAAAVAKEAAGTVGTVRGLLRRLSGGLRVQAGGGAGEAATGLPANGEARPSGAIPRPPRRAYPDTVPFPLAEGVAQAKPLEAIATEQGLPSVSPMAMAMESRERVLAWFALVACGSIFGASLGFLIGILKLTDFTIAHQAADEKLGLLCGLGIFMFWVLGRVVFGVAAAASEDRHLHLVASHRDDPAKVGNWLRRAAIGSLFTLLLISGVLVTVEAIVERYGVISTFVASSFNNAVTSGKAGSVSNGLNETALVFMVLTVSLPFVLLHMAHGWAFARNKAITGHLKGLQMKQAWEIAGKCHEARTQQVAELFTVERAEEEEARRKEDEEAEQAKQEAKAAQVKAEAEIHAGVPGAGAEAAVNLGPEPTAGTPEQADAEREKPGPTSPFINEEPIRRSDVALALARAWEAEQRWRRVRKSRHDAIAWYDARIEAYEADRQRETPRPPMGSVEREKAAYGIYQDELRTFEEAYKREIKTVERMMRAGIVVLLWQALMRPAAKYTIKYLPHS